MDQDQKLIIFLDSLGPDADVDFAKQILQAHDWDLQAALETVTGGVGGPSAPEAAGDVRAPLRTGYVDRLIDTSHEEEAMAAMAASQATETSRQELEDALRASEEEFLRQADIQEQAALAAAMEASQASQASQGQVAPGLANSGLLKAANPDRAVDNSGSHRRAPPSYPEPGLPRSVASNIRGSPGEDPRPPAVPELNPRLNGLPASRPAPSLESRYTPVTAAAFASSKYSNLQPQADGILAGREAARRLETSEKALEKEKPRKAPRVAEEGETKKMPKHVHKAEVAHNSGSMEPLRQSPLDKASAPRQPLSSVSSAAGSFSNKASVPRQAASAAMSSGMPTSIPQSKAAGPRQAAGSSAVSSQLAAGSNLHKAGMSAAGSLPQSKAGAQRHTSSSISSAVPKSGTNLAKSKAGTVRQPTSSTTPSDVTATGSMPHNKAGAPRTMSSDNSGPSSGINTSKSQAPARQPTSSATSGVAAGNNAAAQSPATPAAVAGGNPPVQADVQVTKAAERFAAKEAEDLRREREEAEVKRKEAEAGDQRESDGVVTALQALRRLHLKRDPSELATCLQTLRAYISNLAKYPQEVKYHSINCENSHFRNKVASLEGAVAVLQACGFVADGSKLTVDPEFLKTKGAKLWEALSKVDLILEQVKSYT